MTAKDGVVVQRLVPGLTAARLASFVARAGHAIGLRGAVHVLITGNRDLRALNRRFRGKDRATDVLSFPAPAVYRPDFAGDLAISAALASANARRLGHSAADEIKILALHGLLHLAGFDHESDHGRMTRKEQRLRKALGLPLGLIERTAKLASSNGSGRPAVRRRKLPRGKPSRSGLAKAGLARTR
jgi:probable rRNA maturation factor